MDKKAKLITQILNGEFSMYQKIPGIPPGQISESGFRLERGSVFDAWSEEVLESYTKDIMDAMASGRNLMTEKHARMDNLIPPLSTNPLIDAIVEIESEWQAEMRKRYPHFLTRRGGEYFNDASETEAFVTYIRSELETYSDQTLEAYFQHVSKAKSEGINLAEKKYSNIVNQLGYASLEEYEAKLKTQ